MSDAGEGKKFATALAVSELVYEPNNSPQILIICPTREGTELLKQEILKVRRELTVIKIHGDIGLHKKSVMAADVLVVCPGKFKHFAPNIDWSELKLIVLYNYDKLLQESFGLKGIFMSMKIAANEGLQVLCVSNTRSYEAGKRTDDLVRKYVFNEVNRGYEIDVGEYKARWSIFERNEYIKNYVVDVGYIEQKMDVLGGLIEDFKNEKVMIFCGSNEWTKRLYHKFEGTRNNRPMRYFGARLFGDIDRDERWNEIEVDRKRRRHKERSKALVDISRDDNSAIFATGVLAQVVHIGVDVIINFKLPNTDTVNAYLDRAARIVGKTERNKLIINLVKGERDREMIDDIQKACKLKMNRYIVNGDGNNESGEEKKDIDVEDGEIVEIEDRLRGLMINNNNNIDCDIKDEKKLEDTMKMIDGYRTSKGRIVGVIRSFIINSSELVGKYKIDMNTNDEKLLDILDEMIQDNERKSELDKNNFWYNELCETLKRERRKFQDTLKLKNV